MGAALVACGGGSDGGGGAGATAATTSAGSGSTSSGSTATTAASGGSSAATGSTAAAGGSAGAGGTTGSGGAAGGAMDASLPPGDDAGACGTAMGACVNPTDCAIGKSQLDPKVTACAKSCNGSSKCTADCVMMAGVTMGCAKCYGDVTQCGRDNCSAPCFLDPSSKDCRDCTKAKGCDDKFLACAGW